MRPPLWHPPIELSTAEHGHHQTYPPCKLFVFLRSTATSCLPMPFSRSC